MEKQRQHLLKMFESSSILKSQEITATGIDPKTIQRMVENGEVLKVGRGLYTLSELDPNTHFSLVQAQRRVKSGVICLLSALSFHEIGTQIPRRVWMAIPRSSRTPRISEFSVRFVKFSGSAFSKGISTYEIEGVTIRVYNVAKTIADCFKYRNKLGIDVAIEALRDVVREQAATNDELLQYAEVCRVSNVMKPYLESIAI